MTLPMQSDQNFPRLEGLLQDAIAIATNCHIHQADKAGKPYISYSLRVMAAVDSPPAKIVGVLHDAVEDTELTTTFEPVQRL